MGLTLTGFIVFDKAEHPDALARRLDASSILEVGPEMTIETLDGADWYYGKGEFKWADEEIPALLTWLGESTRIAFFENSFSVDTPDITNVPELYRKLVAGIPGTRFCGISTRELNYGEIQARIDDYAWLAEQGIEIFGVAQPVG